MQKIEYREAPSPHVVVDNFLPIAAARECLEEAQRLEPVYEEALVGQDASALKNDGCDECKAVAHTSKVTQRSNQVVMLDREYSYPNNRYNSSILSSLQAALLNGSFINTMQSFPNLFPLVGLTTHMETILSSYGRCDFYGWHTDALPFALSHRMITCVVHFNTEPRQYEGGELILTGKTLEDQLAYSPVHNKAIFFESYKTVHAVDETIFEGDFKDSRFSINLWLGFVPEHVPESPRAPISYRYRI